MRRIGLPEVIRAAASSCEIEKRFILFRRKTKFVPKKNVMYHLYMSQEVRESHH